MRLVRGTVNAVLMVTLVKPVAHLMVARWRRQVQESPAAAIGIPVQELLEAALIEELGAATIVPETAPTDLEELAAGRSIARIVLVAGTAVVLATGVAVVATRLIRRRRQTHDAGARELVAVAIETGDEVVEDVAQESLIG